jgi:cell division protein FtsB
MNKIETAIERTKSEIKRLKNNKMCFEAQIESLENVLDMLEIIDRNKSIPHLEDNKPPVNE